MSIDNEAGNLLPKVFTFSETKQQVRTVSIDGQPYFVAKDVCDILQLSDVSMSIGRLDEDEKLTQVLFVSGQNREMWFVNESGLYNLIFRSNKPEAKAFRKFVTSVVLPTIRKTGGYNVEELSDIIKQQQAQIKQLERRVKLLTSPRAKKERKRRLEVENADNWIESGRIAAIASENGDWIPFHKIMDAYVQFCKDEHVKRIGKNLLGEKLQRKFDHKKRRDTTWYAVFVVKE